MTERDFSKSAALRNALGIGKRNAQKADLLARMIRTTPERTQLPIRQLAEWLNFEGYPVVSCGRGFFLAETKEEIEGYARSLESRARANLERAALVRQCRPWKGAK